MKPAWDKLVKDYADSKTAGVYDVDCTAAGKPLCDSNGVRGFPTIKYGDPNALEDYQGGRSYDDLKAFADENLGPSCGPDNMDLCDDEKKAKIEEYLKMSVDDLASAVEEKEKTIKDAESHFEKEVEKLQKTYESLVKTKDETIAEVKGSVLAMMKSVLAHNKKKS